MHQLLQQKNILSALGCFTYGTEIWMVMPLMSYGLNLYHSLFLIRRRLSGMQLRIA